MAYPTYRAAGIITGTKWDNFVDTVLDYGGATAVVGFNAKLDGRENYFYCDGVADDVQIQLGIDYAIATNGKVLLEEGTYDVSATLSVTAVSDGFVFEGMGSGADLVSSLGAGVDVIEIPVLVAGRSAIQLKNFRITGNGTEQHGIAINDTVRTGLIRNIRFKDLGGDGVHAEGCFELRVEGCQFSTNNRGIYVGASATRNSHALKILANTFLNQVAEDIYIEGDPNSVMICDNSSTGSGTDSIHIVEAAFPRIIDNYIETPGSDGIHLGSHGTNITSWSLVAFNTISTAGADGIRIDRTTSAKVMFNRVSGAVTNNVEVTANATDAYVENAGAIVDAGTTTIHVYPHSGILRLPIAQGFQFPVYTDGTRPAFGTAGRAIWNSDDNMLNIDSGADWRDTDGNVT